jgi:type VI protein secretion system component Hcp
VPERIGMSRRRFVGTSASAAGVAVGAWLWVPLFTHAQTTLPKPNPLKPGSGTPTPVPKPRAARPPVSQGVQAFLEFPDPLALSDGAVSVAGDSLNADHPHTVEVMSAELGMRQSVDIGSAASGAGAGKAEFQALRIDKAVDLTSADLFAAATQGVFFRQLNLYVRRPNGAAQGDDAVYQFKTVAVTRIEVQNDSTSNQPTETVEFAFGALQITYQSPTGVMPTPRAWSTVLNQPVFDTTPGA